MPTELKYSSRIAWRQDRDIAYYCDFFALNGSVGHVEQETGGCQNLAFGHFLQ